MGTYFHGSNSEIQSSAAADGFHTLYLLNPSTTTTYVPYSDATSHPHPTPNMLLLNPNSSPNMLNLANVSHAPPPSSSNHNPDDPSRPSFLGHEISAFHGFIAGGAAPPRVHYNLWDSMIDHQPTSAVATASCSSGGAPSASASAAADVSPQMSFQRPSQQGLSLSLSSQQTAYRSLSGELDVPGQHQVAAISPSNCVDVRILGPSHHHASSNGISSVQSFVLGSKYLKAAQETLDEVVNVGKGIHKEEATKEKMKANRESTSGGNRDGSSGGVGGETSGNGKQAGELSTAQRQELQMKKSKLASMLDEVEQRYRQYHHQMQIVISSFEQAAGYGAANTYTSLALKTISKQFRCLKDAIASQIKATSKSLGEEDCLGAKVEGSRLRYVDHHLRQQRALQQLGMMQHNAWRPQRGLPERAVSILRAWLFEHFLHPYPKDSDKVMLAKQTGLTRSQVSNWFINARVRLWKPMVEEMYMEEMKEQEGNKEVGSSTKDSQPQESSRLRLDHQMKGFQSNPGQSFNSKATTPTDISNSSIYLQPQSEAFHAAAGSSSHHQDMQLRSPKKPRSSEIMHNSPSSILSVDMEMKPGDRDRSEGNTKFGMERHPLVTSGHGGGYGGFSMEDMGRYNVADQLPPRFHGNGVSLTLGLPHSTDNLPHHGFLSHNMNMTTDGTDFCAINTPPSHSSTNYDNIDIQNRKRFAAQLLPDFVA